MATYLELENISGVATGSRYGDLVKKITCAVGVKARVIAESTDPTEKEIQWAKEALADRNEKRKQIENYLLAGCVGEAPTIDTILDASDSVVQEHVDSAVDKLLSK